MHEQKTWTEAELHEASRKLAAILDRVLGEAAARGLPPPVIANAALNTVLLAAAGMGRRDLAAWLHSVADAVERGDVLPAPPLLH